MTSPKLRRCEPATTLNLGDVKFLSAEIREVNRTRYLTVKILSGQRKQRKNLCCLLKIGITSVIDANENEHTSRRYTVVFIGFGHEIYDDIPLFK